MKVAFQMQALEDANPKVTNSLLFMQEANKRGYEVYHLKQDSLSIDNNGVYAMAARTTIDLENDDFFQHEPYERVDLTTFDIVFMRQLPPVDMGYITNTYILDYLKSKGVYVTNDPSGIRDVPEKLSIFNFPEYIPPTLVSSDIEEIEAFLSIHEEIVVKPLYLFTSKDIIRTKSIDDVREMLGRTDEKLMVQRFLPGIAKGKKRAVIVFGEFWAAFARVPNKGEFLTPLDAPDLVTELTEKEKEICTKVGQYATQNGLNFIGLDLIDSYLIEINNTSPAGLITPNLIYNKNYEVAYWDQLEQHARNFKTKRQAA